ncbi:MAG: permease-like cell division protein FtsX [Psychrilyobacter sp.]|nr:permease-like cell division protein FtsX [Psychrilyobacter sp.]
MFKKLNQINTEVKELIEKNITYYTLSFTTLVFSFIFLNLSLVSMYNLHKINKTMEKNYNFTLYINNNVSKNSIEKLEESVLSIDGVESLSYIDKEQALDKLTKNLGINSTGIKNPLLNSFTVRVNGRENIERVQTISEEIDGVKEIIVNEANSKNLDNRISKNKIYIFYLLLITFIPIKIMIFNIMHSTVLSQKHDIESKIYLGLSKKEVLKPYYFINNIKFITSAVIGSLIFLNLYEIIRTEVPGLDILVVTPIITLVVGIVIAIICIVYPFISINITKRKR